MHLLFAKLSEVVVESRQTSMFAAAENLVSLPVATAQLVRLPRPAQVSRARPNPTNSFGRSQRERLRALHVNLKPQITAHEYMLLCDVSIPVLRAAEDTIGLACRQL